MAELPNIHHLRAFALAARLNSVHRAAAAAHLSQPAVTQALARLEKRYECRFFERRSTGVYPTELGEIMLARVERALELITDAARRLSESARRTSQTKGGGVDRLATTAQLRALVAIARSGGYSAAARSLGLAQPSVHRAARDLERLVGVPLFERISQGVALTPQGRMLALRAALAFREIEAATDDLEEAKGLVRGRLVIGTLPLIRTEILPEAVIALSQRYPQASIRIDDGSYASQLHALHMGEIDLLIGALRQPPPADDLEERELFTDTLSVIARAGHPLAGKDRVTREDLLRFPWIVPRPETPTRAHFEALIGSRFMTGLIETSSLVALRGMLLKSDRLTLLSRRQITYEERSGLLKALPVELGDRPRPIGITLRSNWRPTGLQTAFLEILREKAK
ncbi:DNA-binding transcriptional LysR family regulator [Breoghania corrubedonensis]|uniref:DNA-binding transcriptional LysR family regulator n=1 Tax=Breoghania corrubedonensis TaxID=665038 RepID=A0A2T5VH26_9HYPH|nr:LysR family transcriptional regulator [Breoghania corrubedonensis]PTW63057.1 DNA-binding transcriptional LysR family regulator [Breoghania corrubedonensis]